MSSYTTNHTSLTFSGMFGGILLAGSGSAMGAQPPTNFENYENLHSKPYSVRTVQSSHSESIQSHLNNHIRVEHNIFLEKISNYYSEFAKKQKPLNPDFEKILNDNLSSLYED